MSDVKYLQMEILAQQALIETLQEEIMELRAICRKARNAVASVPWFVRQQYPATQEFLRTHPAGGLVGEQVEPSTALAGSSDE